MLSCVRKEGLNTEGPEETEREEGGRLQNANCKMPIVNFAIGTLQSQPFDLSTFFPPPRAPRFLRGKMARRG